jgi:uncharacterized protein YndB with AHSA1/START domain
MIPTGTLHDDGRTLVLSRTFTAGIDEVWASVTESERLERWFGTWTGDPASGWVMVTMNAEPESQSAMRFDIQACEPPRLLSISAVNDYGNWRLTVELSAVDWTTTLVLRQEEVDPGSLPETGPGWEWYLDRLVAAIAEQAPPTIEDFTADYLPMSTAYAAMLG